MCCGPCSSPTSRLAFLALVASSMARAQDVLPLARHAAHSSPPDRVSYVIGTDVGADANPLNVHATLRIPRTALTNPSEVHLALGRGRTRRHILRLTLGDGRAAPGRWNADSSRLVVPIPDIGDTVVLTAELGVPFDSSGRRQLGYDLYASTDDDDAWYPTVASLKDSLHRFADFDVTITAPASIAVVTSGRTLDSTVSTAGVRRQLRAEHVEGFALAFGADVVVQTIVDGGGIRVHALSSSADAPAFRRVAEEAAAAAAWYRRTYGFFPLEEISIVAGPTGARGGFPMSNVFMIHRGDLSVEFVRWITAHELAHYYWGLYVLDARERLGWLMLGLGIWTDELYLARASDVPLENVWRSPRADNSFAEFADASLSGYDLRLDLTPEQADSLPYDYNSLVRHAKASTGIYLLSQRLGTERFLELQKHLLEEYRDRRLSPEDFGAALEAAGVSGARDFLRAWARGDAQLGYAVRAVRPDSAGSYAYWIRVERTGTIPHPVTIEIQTANGQRKRASLAGEAKLDSLRLSLPGPLVQVRVDPDGVLPSSTSDNVDMRRVFLRAMGSAGPPRAFLSLARAHLLTDRDPDIAALAVERYFELGEWREVRAVARQVPAIQACTTRVTCFAALLVARADARLGASADALALFRRIEPNMRDFGLAGARRLKDAEREILARSRSQPN
jgi:hypothetical protein